MKLLTDWVWSQGAGTNESVLVELLASRSNHQIKAMCDAYLAGLYFLTLLPIFFFFLQ